MPGDAARSSIMSELADGIRWFRSHDLVRSLTFVGASINVGAGGLFAVLVLFAKEDLNSGADAYGILIAIGATGAIIGGLAASRLTTARARRTICMSAAPLTALFLVVLAGNSSYLVTAACLVASGVVVAVVNVVTISLRQSLTPAALIGRVTAVHRVLCWGAVPLGAGLTGLAGQLLGVRAAIAICGATVLVLSAITLPGFLRVTSETFAPAAR
jgi:predicted MFS family arabinose efflux permease